MFLGWDKYENCSLVCVCVYVYESWYFEYQLLNKDEDLENLSSKSVLKPHGFLGHTESPVAWARGSFSLRCSPSEILWIT